MRSIIANKVNRNLKRTETVCPFCKSKDVRIYSHLSTLVGGSPDPNHHTLSCTCNSCSKDFVQEYKRANVWYSREENGEKFVIDGLPSCFENWVLTCSYCGGGVRKTHYELDGRTKAKYLSYSDGKKQYRTSYACDTCHRTEEFEEDHTNDGEFCKRKVEQEKAIWISKHEYQFSPWGDNELVPTKNTLRWRLQFDIRSIHYVNNKNEWSLRLPVRLFFSLGFKKMFFIKGLGGKTTWTYSPPWKVYERPAMVVMNVKGIQKTTFDLAPTADTPEVGKMPIKKELES